MKKTKRLHDQLANARIPPLICKFAIPNTIGLLAITVYSLADSYFVAALGTEASAAVGVTFALHVLIQAVGYTLGMGAGSLLSRCLGEKKNRDAREYCFVAILLSLVSGALITVVGLRFQEALLRLLGATAATLAPARAYVVPLLWSAAPMCATFTLSQLLRSEGKALYSMAGLSLGSLLNIALDPLLITQLNFGISGASIATLISQSVACLFLLGGYLFRPKEFSPFHAVRGGAFVKAGKILITGLPSLFRQGLSGTAAILLNHAAASVSEAALTGVTLVSRLFLLVFSFCLGLAQGMVPVVGYNFGSGDLHRVKKAYSFSLVASTLVMLFFSIPLFILSPQIFSMFYDDPSVIEIGSQVLRAQAVVLFTHGLVTPTIFYLQTVGRPFLATTLAVARQGLFYLPLILTLPARFGLWGVEWSQPLADAATFLFAIPFLLLCLKSTKKPKIARREV